MSAYFTNKTLPKMVRGLRKMHQVGIWVRDIHYKNYHAGGLIDFSYALTMPNPYLKREIMEDREKIPPEESLIMDAIYMDEIIYWNRHHPRAADKVWVRMLPSEEYRSRTRVGKFRAVYDQYPYRPEEYDWKAAGKVKNGSDKKKRTKQHIAKITAKNGNDDDRAEGKKKVKT